MGTKHGLKRHKHKRPGFGSGDYVPMILRPAREEGIRTSTKKKTGRRIIATGQTSKGNSTTTYELHSTKGYRSQRTLREVDDEQVQN